MLLNGLAVLNLTLLIVHQIDAAFWHEWEMFGIPGGIQVFNLLNMVIFVPLLMCLVMLVERRAAGYAASLFMAVGCGLVLPIHAGFALAGYEQFDLPVSIAVIVTSFAAAVAQGATTLRSRREFS